MNDIVKLNIGEAEVSLPRDSVVQRLLESFGSAPTNVPKIGEYWPGQGGVNAGLMRGVDGEPDYFLIVPADDCAYFENLEWGGRGKDEPGASSEWDGLANTRALVASKHSHPLAEACASVEIDGHKDFYLMARREQALARANVPELFENGWHWSSTQYSASLAWFQDFDVGGQGHYDKDTEARARAVRRLVVHSSI